MRFSLIAVALCGAVTAVENDFLRRKQQFENRRESNIASLQVDDSETVAAPQFLNSKTKKFKVDGTSLPEIPFDVGESYAGTLPVEDEANKDLFFWFFPQSTPGAKKEITIWLNGGPGCSSLVGFFEENGPVRWEPGTFGPKKNPLAWNKLTNMVWVDQPVSTGFSEGKWNATSEIGVAQQFRGFWKNFVDTFSLHGYKIYITGESYAGQYVPYIADGFLNQTDTKYFDVNGILFYDPVVGSFELINPPALAFAQHNRPLMPFEQSFYDELGKVQEQCGFNEIMEKGLTFPPKGKLPKINNSRKCQIYDRIYNEITELNPCFNIYHVSDSCPAPADPLVADKKGIEGPKVAYFNRKDVKQALHAPHKTWAECNGKVNRKFDQSPGSAAHHNGPVARVAEKTNNVIIGHATLDYILLANQTLLTLNNLVWNGKQGFEEPPNKPLYAPHSFKANKVAYYGDWTESRGITFTEVNLSGHMVPQYQPPAAYRHLQKLLGVVSSLSDKSPFS